MLSIMFIAIEMNNYSCIIFMFNPCSMTVYLCFNFLLVWPT